MFHSKLLFRHEAAKIEHSKNAIITSFGNEVGPGVLQSVINKHRPSRIADRKERIGT